MKKISIYILALATLVGASSCQKFLDVNDDVDRPFTSTPDSLLPAVIGNYSTSHYDHGEVTSYFTQQIATLSAWDKYKDRWDYVDANRIGQWRRHYHDIGINVMHVLEATERYEGNAENYKAVAKIVYAGSVMMTSDLFGDIAYKEAFQGLPYAKYDDQEYIYKQVDKLLDAAITHADSHLKNSGNSLVMDASVDNVFAGDMQKWKAYALALKARRALHLTPNVNTDYATVIQHAEAALNAGFENAGYDYSIGNNSVDYQVNQWGKSTARPSWDYQQNILNKSAVTDFFLIRGLKYDSENNVIGDPRTLKLIGNLDEKDYKYVVSGEGKPDGVEDTEYPSLYGSYITRDDAIQPFMTKEELYFILAEAYLSSNKAESFKYFQMGIEENMLHAGVSSEDAQNYISNAAFLPVNESELTLTHVMMQKYVALWLQGEVWVDMRRHGYSDVYAGLTRPKNLIWYFADDADAPWIERLPYDTETEEIYNKPQLVEMGAFQNPDWLKKKMYWAKN